MRRLTIGRWRAIRGRLPIRWRVTIAFSVALVGMMTLLGGFIYLRMDADLMENIDRGLQSRAEDVVSALRSSPDGWERAAAGWEGQRARILEADESLVQILRADGSVLAASPQAGIQLLSDDQLRRARAGPLIVDRQGDAQMDESVRLMAEPVQIGGPAVGGPSVRGATYVVVVGTSLDEKREALSSLLLVEVVGMVAALLGSAAAGYLVAGLALRPVEAMRRTAEGIAERPEERLPVSRQDDELGRLGRTLNAMLDQIERARIAERELVNKERRFVADASHELRTPLTILKSEIEVTLLGSADAADLRAALVSAGEETDRLCHLTDDLLALAQATDGGPATPSRRELVDVPALLEHVVERELARAANLGRSIVITCASDVSTIASPGQLERALSNLLDNALRHGAGDVHLLVTHVGDEICIAVLDQGLGFPEQFEDRAFERFTRAAPGRTGPGTGLGLAIVQAVAQVHGGRAEAGNTDLGARVQIFLPVK